MRDKGFPFKNNNLIRISCSKNLELMTSFDFLPLSSSLQSTADSHFVRPRAFSACHQVFESLHFPGSTTFEFSGLARERWRSTGPLLRRSLQSRPWCRTRRGRIGSILQVLPSIYSTFNLLFALQS